MILLRWQAAILNRIYETKAFDRIIHEATSIQKLDYRTPIDVWQSLTESKIWEGVEELLGTVRVLYGGHPMEEKRRTILHLQEAIKEVEKVEGQRWGILHVIVFSALSKCSIWPGMYKTSLKILPSLIGFYSRFHADFSGLLDYKFDPLVLSSKYGRIVNDIRQRRLANPQLFKSVESNDIETIRRIAKQNPLAIKQSVQEGYHVTHHAAFKSSIQTMRALLDLGADYEAEDDEQQTPLFYAVKRFDLEIVQFLVEEIGVVVNKAEYQLRTPIYLAAFEGNLPIVKYLYSKGADPQLESKLSRTPLSKACYLGNLPVAEYLVSIGVNLCSKDSKGRTALHNAAWGQRGGRQGKRRGHIMLQDSPECVQLLLKAGHPIDFQDFDGFTALFSAVSSHAQRSIRLLVAAGASLTHKTLKGQSVVFIASKYGHLPILKILIQQYTCDYQIPSSQGFSPLAASLTLNSPSCCHYLFDLYFKDNRALPSLPQLYSCLFEYKKTNNSSYLTEWLCLQNDIQRKQSKCKFFASGIEESISSLLSSALLRQNEDLYKGFLLLTVAVFIHLPKSIVQDLLKMVGESNQLSEQATRLILLAVRSGFKIEGLTLSGNMHQQTVVQLLFEHTNLTNSLQSLKSTFKQLIQLRFTRALISLLKNLERQGPKHLSSILLTPQQGSLNLIDYCLVNGFYDVHRLLNSFLQEYPLNSDSYLHSQPIIPLYYYKQDQIEQIQSILHQSSFSNLSFQFFSKFASQSELKTYQQIIQQQKQFISTPKLVREVEDLDNMIEYLKDKKILGIDIEHYSSSSEYFICLIQISTFDQVFIIDRLSNIGQKVGEYFQQLFGDENKIKIFHSFDNDLKWLAEDFLVPHFRNIIDTSRVYTLLSHQKSHTPSLKTLAKIYLNLDLRKQFQKADWRIRPLFREMLDYAALDAQVLPFLLLKMLQDIQKGVKLPQSKQSKRLIKASTAKNTVLTKVDC